MRKICLANLPTKIEKLENLSASLGKNIYIKRDDYTGVELSGNKIRKLEYILNDALNKEVDTVITCGALGSNHARATVFACRKLGIEPKLLLAGDESLEVEGNRFFDLLAGAEIKYISNRDYANSRDQVMEKWADELRSHGKNPLVIPQGASNALGSFGYENCYREIVNQERELGVVFDAIAVTIGSAGTYAGLVYGSEIEERKIPILGFSISEKKEIIKDELLPVIFKGMNEITGEKIQPGNLYINDKYIGLGYAKSRVEEVEFIKDFTKLEGIILDPVYTGKAMYGLENEIINNELQGYENILFIHTGGVFGWAKNHRELIY